MRARVREGLRESASFRVDVARVMTWLLGPVGLVLLATLVTAQGEPASGLETHPRQLYTIVVAAAFIPPIIYAVMIRHVETLNREPWGALARAFFYGAFFSVLIALVLEILFSQHF